MDRITKFALVAFISILLLDFCWLHASRHMYSILVKSVQGTPMNVRIGGAVAAYILMFASFLYVVGRNYAAK